MTYVPDVVSRAIKLMAVFAFGLALTACTISSKAELVSDAEGKQVLPAAVYFFGYDEDEAAAGNYKRADDEPVKLTLKGNTYSSDDGSINARFVPLAEPDTYLIAIVNADGSLYGVARLRDNFLVTNVILEDADPSMAISDELTKGGEAAVLSDVTSADGGLVITNRATLDYLVKMHLEDRLAMAGMVMFVADKPDATPPAKIAMDGEFAKAI